MDTKLLNLCSVVCLLFCYTCAAEEPKSDNKPNNVNAILQDMQMAAGEHYQDDGGHADKGFFSKGLKGGFDKGSKKYSSDDYDKKGTDYGKAGNKKYDAKDKWGNNKWDKKNLNTYGDKWGDKSGKADKGKFEEWADQKKWKTDKGKGYEKAYEYDKSEGKKDSFAKKGKHDSNKYEDKHGEKHGLNKKQMGGKDNYGKKLNNGKMDWKDWGSMYKKGGKNNKGMKYYESKKPSTHKSSKWEKKAKKPKSPPPKKHDEEQHEEPEHGGYEDHGSMGAEDGQYDMGVHGGMEGHDLASAYDHGGEVSLDEHGLGDGQLMTQEEAYAALAKAGISLDDQSGVLPVEDHDADFY